MKNNEKVPMPSDVIMTPGMTLDEYYAARKIKRAEFFECMKKKSAEITAMHFAILEKLTVAILAQVDRKIEKALTSRSNKRTKLQSANRT
jgi:hypothetical protein